MQDNVTIMEQVQKAIHMVSEGVCRRVDVSDTIKVYACKNTVRIDIKTPGLLGEVK